MLADRPDVCQLLGNRRGPSCNIGDELPIFLVDAFTSEPFRGNSAGVVLGHGDDAWMQRVAAEMKHSETAFVRPRRRRQLRSALVHSRGRSRPVRPRDARDRARARARPTVSTPITSSTRAAARCRRPATTTVRSRSTFRSRSPNRPRRSRHCSTALGIDTGRVPAHRRRLLLLRRRRCRNGPHVRTRLRSAPRPHSRARRLRDRSRATRDTTSSRAASPRASVSTKTPSPARCIACSSRTGRRDSASASCARFKRRRAAAS